jgi:prolyl oligopeptidase
VGLLTAVICSSALAMQSVAAQTDKPPTARTVDVVDHVFGNTLHDPYRWMEGEHNVEFQQWLTAQGAYTRSKLDGSHRAILFGYGSYGLSLVPSFKPVRLEWVKQGNIFAYAHVRGGGEKGEAWHQAGKGPNKHKGVEDFVASVARLSELGYSNPQRTGLYSRSGGGLLLGNALVHYSNKFGAAILAAAFLNPVRMAEEPNGANQFGEMGDPRKASDFPSILAMDPYQNIRPHTAYPPVMLDVGANDSRVAPWESGKFAARLRAANTSGRPIWIRTDNGGHGMQKSLGAEVAEFADIYAFLDAQLPQ